VGQGLGLRGKNPSINAELLKISPITFMITMVKHEDSYIMSFY